VTPYEQALIDLTLADERVVVMTAENRAAIRSLPDKIGSRFIDVGICEQTLIGVAAGLARRGRRPVVHALAAFLTMRAFEFIRTDIGIGRLPVTLVGAVSGLLSDGNGPTHQAIEDVSLMRGIPNMQVYCPADQAELVACLPAFIESRSPAYMRYCALPPAAPHTEPFAPGKAETLGTGSDVAILTYGFLLREALVAQSRLAEQGIAARVVNLRTLKPIDDTAILDAVHTCRLTVTLEDHFLTGGLYSIVAELLLSRGAMGRVLPFALRERWFTPGRLAGVLAAEGFTGPQIATRIQEALA